MFFSFLRKFNCDFNYLIKLVINFIFLSLSFNSAKPDAPIGQQMNNVHGRFIKKAKRRLGKD